jgi:hypothetical protein
MGRAAEVVTPSSSIQTDGGCPVVQVNDLSRSLAAFESDLDLGGGRRDEQGELAGEQPGDSSHTCARRQSVWQACGQRRARACRQTSSRSSGATWARLALVREQISSIEKTRAERLERAACDGAAARQGDRYRHRDGGYAGAGDPVAEASRSKSVEHSSVPTAYYHRRRAQRWSRTALFQRRRRLVLDHREHCADGRHGGCEQRAGADTIAVGGWPRHS